MKQELIGGARDEIDVSHMTTVNHHPSRKGSKLIFGCVERDSKEIFAVALALGVEEIGTRWNLLS